MTFLSHALPGTQSCALPERHGYAIQRPFLGERGLHMNAKGDGRKAGVSACVELRALAYIRWLKTKRPSQRETQRGGTSDQIVE